MHNFKVGDWVYAHDWCYGQIIDITENEATVEFETTGGGGSFSFELSDLQKAPAPKTYSIRDNLLVTAAVRAGHMDARGYIDIPVGLEGEDRLAAFITELVDQYIQFADEYPFDLYVESALKMAYEKGENSQ